MCGCVRYALTVQKLKCVGKKPSGPSSQEVKGLLTTSDKPRNWLLSIRCGLAKGVSRNFKMASCQGNFCANFQAGSSGKAMPQVRVCR